jgi:uncharacterized membrane protein
MVYWPNINFVITSALILITFFVLSPFIYTFWNDSLRPLVPNTAYANKLIIAGDLLFKYWMVLGYLIPGLVIGWGFAEAARTGTQEQGQGYSEG